MRQILPIEIVPADRDLEAVTPDTEVAKLLEIFHERNLGEIPVVKDKDGQLLMGIIEQRDLLRALHKEDPE